jgi:pyridinium-3,5-biscarboxylic acid mononucleotide synthase
VDAADLRGLLEDVRSGAVSPDDAVARLARLPFADIGVAKIDHHRSLRQGMVEAVYGPGKSPDVCARIVGELLAAPDGGPVLVTRVDDAQAAVLLDAHPAGRRRGSTVVWRATPARPERVLVVTAGTADLPVADECVTTLEAVGFAPDRLTDVGVAGIHRLLAHLDTLTAADAVVVVAGMEGALASVVGGIASSPVVAVPTSVGYGAGLEGVTALLGMLASCAAGISVVGIDNGFGAAMAVSRMLPVPVVTVDRLPR